MGKRRPRNAPFIAGHYTLPVGTIESDGKIVRLWGRCKDRHIIQLEFSHPLDSKAFTSWMGCFPLARWSSPLSFENIYKKKIETQGDRVGTYDLNKSLLALKLLSCSGKTTRQPKNRP